MPNKSTILIKKIENFSYQCLPQEIGQKEFLKASKCSKSNIFLNENVKSSPSKTNPVGTQRCRNVVFLKSLLQPKSNVVTTLSFWRWLSDLVLTLQQRRDSEVFFPGGNLKVFQYHYNFLFPKICNIAWQFHFLIKKISFVCVNAKRWLKWWMFENLKFIVWKEKKIFWSCVVQWSEAAPCILATNSVELWFNYFLRSGNQKTWYNTYILR